MMKVLLKTKHMNQHSSKYIYDKLTNWILIILLSFTLHSANGQTCDFTTGPVSLVVTGGNQTDQYSTIYVLTNIDGIITDMNIDAPEFEVLDQGFYLAYAINFKDGTTMSGISIGEDIGLVTGDDCFDVGVPFGFSVCEEISPCNYCLGETITLTTSGGNTDPGFVTRYVLITQNGEIVLIQDTPVFENIDAGIYWAVAVNFDSTKVITGFEVGMNLGNVESGCLDIGDPLAIGICDQLSPTIFYDLNGCDITQTATLRVGETFSTYEWNTGSTEDFIVVSATEPNTYRVTVTLENGCIGIGEQRVTGNEISRLGDFVWEDSNSDGRQDATEDGINGVTVNLYADFDRNGVPDFPNFPSCVTTTTNHPSTGEPGFYEFTLYQSNYIVGFEFPTGFVPTDQNLGDESRDSDINESGLTGSIRVDEAVVINNVDAGFRTSSMICGTVWEDADGDGRRDLTEEGLDGISLNLYNSNGDLVVTTVTLTDGTSGEAGVYCFDNIAVGTYYVEIVLPQGRAVTEANIGNDEAADSDATGANGPNTTDLISTFSGVTVSDVTFGIYTGGTVCGLVWKENTEGLGVENVYDEGIDSVIANSQVEIVNALSDDVVYQTSTSEDGTYCITGISAGSYQVRFRASVAGTDYVQANQGNDPLLDSDVDINTGRTAVFFVAPGDSINGINAGLRLEALPIDLLSFTGHRNNNKNENVLQWVTATEINNDFFEVQRLVNNEGSFSTIAVVDGSGTTTDLTEYQFRDSEIPSSGTYYYRLKQVDYDGGFEYSNIVALDVFLNFQAGLKVYPNPVEDNAFIEITAEKDDNVTIALTDIMGREITNHSSQRIFTGRNIIDIPVKDIPNGSYVITVQIGSIKQYESIQIAR